MLQAVELALEMLSDAGKHNVPRSQPIGQFKTIADSVRHWYLPAEQQVGRSLYDEIAGKPMNLPELQLGSPFPPTALVERETALPIRHYAIGIAAQPDGNGRRAVNFSATNRVQQLKGISTS